MSKIKQNLLYRAKNPTKLHWSCYKCAFKGKGKDFQSQSKGVTPVFKKLSLLVY